MSEWVSLNHLNYCSKFVKEQNRKYFEGTGFKFKYHQKNHALMRSWHGRLHQSHLVGNLLVGLVIPLNGWAMSSRSQRGKEETKLYEEGTFLGSLICQCFLLFSKINRYYKQNLMTQQLLGTKQLSRKQTKSIKLRGHILYHFSYLFFIILFIFTIFFLKEQQSSQTQKHETMSHFLLYLFLVAVGLVDVV